jgi:hypothetical protein
MPSGYNSHLLCCLCVTVTHFMCCDLWSDLAQLHTMVHCCNVVVRPVLPAKPGYCTVHYNDDIHSSAENEVYRVRQWSGSNFNG